MANGRLKVGVITMHRVVNYGSVLQAYATRRIVELLGFDCEIVDYAYPNPYHLAPGSVGLHRTWKNRVAKALWLKKRWRRKNRFERFARRHLRLSRRYPSREAVMSNPPRYDVYLTGSDQVWNPRHMRGDDVFLLSFAPVGARRVSYASSFACGSLTEDMAKAYAPLLDCYDALSVREENGRELIRRLIGRDAFVGLDPTLLLDAAEWRAVSGGRNPYYGRSFILLYVMSYAFNPAPYIYKLSEHLQQATGMEVITLAPLPAGTELRRVTVLDEASPVIFLRLFDAAGCVVTSSFHGTAFAVNFGKPLYSLVNDDETEDDDRQVSLLKRLGLDSCIIKMNTSPDKVPGMEDVRTSSARARLEALRDKSIGYLKKSLEV